MMAYNIVICLLVVFVALLIRAEYAEKQKQVYFFKPVSTFLVITIVLLSLHFDDGTHRNYNLLILLGLVFCMGGDVALMFKPKTAFTAGLVLFLIGHIVYTVVFVAYNGFWVQNYFAAGGVILAGILIYSYLHSGLAGMKIPVLAYVVVISVMVNNAVSTFYSGYFNLTQALLLSFGAGLFFVSDIILAINRFKKPLKYERFGLSLYYSGQLLIALSTRYFVLGHT
ncbi:MAG: lysoplasmalogenase [Proteobacteria bacterium]|nr:lysoplasmalogenase [Pseudomonadota bacterium]